METETQPALDYRRIETALHYIEAHFQEQPNLQEIAAAVHLSPFHFERMFSRWAGTTPQRFLHFLTKEHARQLLDESKNLLQTAHESGLSGAGRLHDLFVNYEALSPGEYKQRGAGLTVQYGVHATPFGEVLLASTTRGILEFRFLDQNFDEVLAQLKTSLPNATFVENQLETGLFIKKIFPEKDVYITDNQPITLLLRGTNFQIKVWEALLRIPAGKLVSYDQIAAQIGQPKAARAVGTAIGSNRIGLLIPCHRVIQKVGGLGGYRWGTTRKKAILGWEMAQVAV